MGSVADDRRQAVSTTAVLPAAAPPQRRARRRGATFLLWLRRIHLWVGLWGAALGLLFGATGILMNHRAILKIPVTMAVQKSVQLPLPDPDVRGFQTANEMAQWLQAELKFDGLQTRIKSEPPRTVVWDGREMRQPARWTFNLQSPQRGVSAEYLVGNRFIKVDTLDATPLGALARLHRSAGVTAFWVLLSDSIAGGLIVLSITGLLLWSRLHTIRLSAVAVSMAALLAGIWFTWTSF